MAAPSDKGLNEQSEAEIKKFVRRRLGGGTVDVELTEEQIGDCIDTARRWFSRYIAQIKNVTIQISPNGGEYDVAPDCAYVTDVAFTRDNRDIFTFFDWAGVEISPLNYGMYYGPPGGSYSYLTQARQFIEQAKKLISTDPDWYWDRAKRKLVITPTSGQVNSGLGNTIVVEYATRAVDLERLDDYEYELLRRYALAEAMDLLGQIRSKYSSWPSASGEASLNGDSLISNADVMRNELNEAVKKLRRPDGFFAF